MYFEIDTKREYARILNERLRTGTSQLGKQCKQGPVYGYVKDPNDPHHWLIDPEAALVVKKIFTMCMEGRGPSQIANQLRADQVLTPTAYQKSQGRGIHR